MSTTATPPDPVPANDAFAAWNNRPAVTRADSYPVRIQIPALKVDTFVEQIGERADGSMATPTNPSQVAWYSYGAIPGENGNVVMAGHFDRIDGSPAVFWELAKLQRGDTVIVYDSTQTAYHYVVSDQQSYPYNKAPLAEIFGFDLVSRLNLITCRGSWDRNRQTYSQRLVVYTELEKIVPGPNQVSQ
jgi:sortase (surface protein transpeptidase)